MSSVTVTGTRYLVNPESVDRKGPFDIRILAEGDSWMDRSSPTAGSLPDYLAEAFDRKDVSALIINISHASDTLKRITDTIGGEFNWWLRQYRYDAIVLSAGGNDFIDAARDPAPGTGLLKDMIGLPLPADGFDCVDQLALKALVQDFLAPNFDVIYQRIRSDRLNFAVPLFLNCYDTPVARDAPAARGIGPWLFDAYTKNHIDETLWPSLTAGMFNEGKSNVEAWSTGRTGVFAVPTSGLLTPAAPKSKGSSGDWENEIHPNKSGWRKLSKVWVREIRSVLAV